MCARTYWVILVGAQRLLKNWRSHIDASHSRQPLVKGERLVRYEVNAVMATKHGRSNPTYLHKMNVLVEHVHTLPHQSVCCVCLRAWPVQHLEIPEQAQVDFAPTTIVVTSKSTCGWNHINCQTEKSRSYIWLQPQGQDLVCQTRRLVWNEE